MSNTEWKKGYEEGFAAGWKAAKEGSLNYQNYPPVYYSASPTGSFSSTMADTLSIVGGGLSTTGYSPGSGTYTVQLNEKKKINNLTDHTRIV